MSSSLLAEAYKYVDAGPKQRGSSIAPKVDNGPAGPDYLDCVKTNSGVTTTDTKTGAYDQI